MNGNAEFLGVGMFFIFIGVLVTIMPTIVKIHQAVKFITMYFNICKSYIHKKALKF